MAAQPPGRNAERSKEIILEAASALFADKGFNGTSVQQIATAAGVALGTPNYFFGSKENLYKAALERECERARLVVPEALAVVGQNASPETLVSALIDSYLDYLNENPRFLRLIQWTALQRPALMDDVESHWQTVLSAVAAVSLVSDSLVSGSSATQGDVKQLTLSVLGLCTFHFFFGQMVSKPLGLKTGNARFLAERKKHLKLFLTTALHGLNTV